MIIYTERKVGVVSRYLVDADALVSLAVVKDNGHEWALKVRRFLDEEKAKLILTSYAYGEVVTIVSMRIGHNEAVRIAKAIEKDEIVEIVEVDRELRLEGLEWFARQRSKNARFTDCVNMALMEKLGIEEVFSRDKHYKQNGFKRLGLD